MAPLPPNEDFYAILELDQTATSEQIKSSYKRLALVCHPDKGGLKEDFQLLKLAHDTLMSKDDRRDYDRLYPSTQRNRSSPSDTPNHYQSSRTPGSSDAASARTPNRLWLNQMFQDFLRNVQHERQIREAKSRRIAEWRLGKHTFKTSIAELREQRRQLLQEIEELGKVTDGGATIVENGSSGRSPTEQERQSAWSEKLNKAREYVLRDTQLCKEERAQEKFQEAFVESMRCVDTAIRSFEDLLDARRSILNGIDEGWDRKMKEEDAKTRREQKEREELAAQAERFQKQQRREREEAQRVHHRRQHGY